VSACADCLRRAWLLRRLSGHLDQARGRVDEVLALSDAELIGAVGGRHRGTIEREFGEVEPGSAPAGRAMTPGLEMVCRHDDDYPEGLRALASPPSVLHVLGGLDWASRESVAIVGARNATAYGLDMARSLGRALAGAGIPVISGLALGIDSAAHGGAIAAGAPAPTVAVLPGPCERPYPAGRKRLYRQILATGGCVLSELPAGSDVRRWSFPARNRIIAGLSAMTVVVDAGARSGALVTAAHAAAIGRPVGAVPGRVTSPQSIGSNGLLAAGATVIRDAQDVLDRLFGAGAVSLAPAPRPPIAAEARTVLAAIARGHDTTADLARAGVPAERGLAVLASLELDGYVARGPGGRFRLLP
jgi:DNA processing protein